MVQSIAGWTTNEDIAAKMKRMADKRKEVLQSLPTLFSSPVAASADVMLRAEAARAKAAHASV